MSSLPKIANFPHDNKIWIIHSYGGVVQNTRGGYLAELLMNEFVDKKVTIKTKICRVPVRDLDFVKIGTVWKNQTFINDALQTQNDHEYSFDFVQCPPEIIPLSQTKIYSARGYNKLDTVTNEHFKNSNYLSITTTSGTTVLIPVLEVLSSIILPDNKEIREKLLIKDTSTILKEYLEEYYIESPNYIIKPKIEHMDRTLIFLAYMGLNKVAQQRLSKVLSSMLITYLNPQNNTPITYKHPEILPFQPSRLTLQGKCKEIDENIVLMYQVTGVSDEKDYDVLLKKIIYEETNSKNDKQNKKYSYQSIGQLLDESDILEDNNPHFRNGHVQTRSKVKRIGQQRDVLIQEERKERESVEREWFIGDKKTSSISSADKDNKKESEDITQNKIGNDMEKEKQLPIFKQVVSDLLLLQENKQIDRFKYITNQGKEVAEKDFCKCDLSAINRQERTWFRKKVEDTYRNRKFLILKIYIGNTSIYVLEIEQIKKGEKYAGILFQCNKLDEKSIQELLQQIGKNKGTYVIKKKQNNNIKALPIGEYKVYFHYKNKNNICFALRKNYGIVSCKKEKIKQEESTENNQLLKKIYTKE